MEFNTSTQLAKTLDTSDPCKHCRELFLLPTAEDGQESLYLLGNSLGLQPKATQAALGQILEDWAQLGVEAHFKGEKSWLAYSTRVLPLMAPLVGALPAEVVLMNSLSVNLHLLLVSFFQPTTTRYKVLIEAGAFPSDRYVVKSFLEAFGFDPEEALIEVSPRAGEETIRTEVMIEAIEAAGGTLALVLVGGVNFLTGQVFDMPALTRAGHAVGAKVGFDLAHGVGNIPLALHDWNVDFAAWCNYKYVNAGPASIAGCYIHERYHRDKSLKRLAGWWGLSQTERLKMPADFSPNPTAEGWMISNASPLQLATLEAALNCFAAAGLDKLQEKSQLLTSYFYFLLKTELGDRVEVITPEDPSARGAQLSLRFQGNAAALHQQLSANHIVCDLRPGNIMRMAPVPLYTRFLDVWTVVAVLKSLL